jgi:ADP-heptose:LPS heptosyltransferase
MPPELVDCSHLSFRQAAAVLSTCDVFCGVDSSFFNLCPALGVPAIGLFGPVDWRTRVKEGMGQTALSGVGYCAPCGWTNSRAGHKFPPNGPCAKTGFCVPLADIKPERIVAKIDSYRAS